MSATVDRFDLTYISVGFGVQSTALLAMSCLGLRGAPKADVGIFADTQAEPAWVYEHARALGAWSRVRGITVETVTAGSLTDKVLLGAMKGDGDRFISIPAFVAVEEPFLEEACLECRGAGVNRGAEPCADCGGNGCDSCAGSGATATEECPACRGEGGKWSMRPSRAAPLRRQCTREYKIEPIERRVREILGFKRGERIHGKKRVRALIGISLDESQRMKPNRNRWIENQWPLVDARMTRRDCEAILREVGLPVPMKSSCVYCQFHSDEFWRSLRADHPKEWARAVEMDARIRKLQIVRGDVFLHRSLRPLEEAVLERERDLFSDLECEGYCHE